MNYNSMNYTADLYNTTDDPKVIYELFKNGIYPEHHELAMINAISKNNPELVKAIIETSKEICSDLYDVKSDTNIEILDLLYKAGHYFDSDDMKHLLKVYKYDSLKFLKVLTFSPEYLEENKQYIASKAIKRGDHKVLELLLKDKEHLNIDGLFIEALGQDSTKIIDVFLNNGQDINADNALFKIKNVRILEHCLNKGFDLEVYKQTMFDTLKDIQYPQVFEYLFDIGFDVNVTNEYGDNLLFVYFNRSNFVRILIEKGINVNNINGLGRNVLFNLMKSQLAFAEHETLLMLLRSGIDVNILDNNGDNIMSDLVKCDYDTICLLHEFGLKKEYYSRALCNCLVELINNYVFIKMHLAIEKGMCDLETTDSDGMTLLMHIVKKGYVNDIKYLIKMGANVNTENPFNGNTAICYALYEDTVMCLLENGATVNENALENCYNFCSSIKYLGIKSEEALFHTLRDNNLTCFKLLLKQGASVDKTNIFVEALSLKRTNFYDTLLETEHSISTPGVMELYKIKGIKYLVDNDIIGAIKNNDITFIKELVDNNVVDINTPQVLFNTVTYGDLSLLEYFISKGLDINHLNDNNETALFPAILYRKYDIIDFLLRNLDNLGQQSSLGLNIISISLIANYEDLFELLLEMDIPSTSNPDHMFMFCINIENTESLLNKGFMPKSINTLLGNNYAQTLDDTITAVLETTSPIIIKTAIDLFPEYKEAILTKFASNPFNFYDDFDYFPNNMSLNLAEYYITGKLKLYVTKLLEDYHSKNILFHIKDDLLKHALYLFLSDKETENISTMNDVSYSQALKIFTTPDERSNFLKFKGDDSQESIEFFDLDKERDILCCICLCNLSGVILYSECCPTSTRIHKKCYDDKLETCVICREDTVYI